MRNKLVLFTAVAVLLLVASTARADLLPPPDFKVTVELTPTRYGASLNAGGWAELMRWEGKEFFSLQVFAKLEEATLIVYGLGETDEWFTIGEVKLFGGGSRIAGAQGNWPRDHFPVTELRKVAVYYGKFHILTGSFELMRE